MSIVSMSCSLCPPGASLGYPPGRRRNANQRGGVEQGNAEGRKGGGTITLYKLSFHFMDEAHTYNWKECNQVLLLSLQYRASRSLFNRPQDINSNNTQGPPPL